MVKLKKYERDYNRRKKERIGLMKNAGKLLEKVNEVHRKYTQFRHNGRKQKYKTIEELLIKSIQMRKEILKIDYFELNKTLELEKLKMFI